MSNIDVVAIIGPTASGKTALSIKLAKEIEEMFHMSKGAFKRALGTLMKARKINQKDGWTEIV